MYEAAIVQLIISAETCEHNAPINEAEGRHDQAANDRYKALSYRAAIEVLEARSRRPEAAR